MRLFLRNREVRSVTYPNADWSKIDYPAVKQLWCRVVGGFTLLALIGAIFLVVGAVFLPQARRLTEQDGVSLAVVWCIISIGTCT